MEKFWIWKIHAILTKIPVSQTAGKHLKANQLNSKQTIAQLSDFISELFTDWYTVQLIYMYLCKYVRQYSSGTKHAVISIIKIIHICQYLLIALMLILILMSDTVGIFKTTNKTKDGWQNRKILFRSWTAKTLQLFQVRDAVYVTGPLHSTVFHRGSLMKKYFRLKKNSKWP